MARWLAEGPETVSDGVARAALLEVTITPQQGSALRWLRASMAGAPLQWAAAAAAAILVAVVTLGLFFSRPLVGDDRSPTPSIETSPTAEPSRAALPPANDSVLLPAPLPDWRFHLLGVDFELPSLKWRLGQETTPTSVRFWTPFQSYPTNSFTILAGDSQGTVRTCTNPRYWEICKTVTPTSVDDLVQAVSGGWGPIGDGGIGPVNVDATEITLGGESAVLVRIRAQEGSAHGVEVVTYVLTIHEGRPYVLRFHTSDESGASDDGGAWFANTLETFRFSDGMEASLVTHTSPDGYQVLIPQDWTAGKMRYDGSSCPQPTGYGHDGLMNRPLMSVSIGAPSGKVMLVRGPGRGVECVSISPANIDELQAAALRAFTPDLGGEFIRDLELDGEEARYIGIDPATWTSAGSGYGMVFAYHDGRPVVITFDAGGCCYRWAGGDLNTIIDSFRWVIAATAPG
jgi:hypothetical protein